MHSKTAKVSVEYFASLYSLSFEGSTYFQSIEVSTITHSVQKLTIFKSTVFTYSPLNQPKITLDGVFFGSGKGEPNKVISVIDPRGNIHKLCSPAKSQKISHTSGRRKAKCTPDLQNGRKENVNLGRVPLGSTVSAPAAAMWVGWVFCVLLGKTVFGWFG